MGDRGNHANPWGWNHEDCQYLSGIYTCPKLCNGCYFRWQDKLLLYATGSHNKDYKFRHGFFDSQWFRIHIFRFKQYYEARIIMKQHSIHLGRLEYIDVNKLEHHWFRYWFVTCLVANNYLNQCCLFVNWTDVKTFDRNLSQTLIRSRKGSRKCSQREGGHFVLTSILLKLLNKICKYINTSHGFYLSGNWIVSVLDLLYFSCTEIDQFSDAYGRNAISNISMDRHGNDFYNG